MSWLSDSDANRFKKSYIQGFLDVSGGNLIVESSSTIQVMSSEYSGQAALLIKPDRFSVFTGQSSYDISYVTFAALGYLGASYEYTTADVYNRIQFISSNTLLGNKTSIGSDASYTDLIVYGNVETRSNGNIIGAKNLLLTGDASLNQKLYVAGNANLNSNLSVNIDLSVNQNMFVTGQSQFNNDVSMNRNVDIGTGNNSVAINKDISANIALDVSGTTVLRGPLSITRDLSLNQSLQIGSDLSVNRFLYVGNNALFNTDVSVNQNLYVTGRASFGRPPANGTAFELDLSGQMRIYETVGTAATATTGSLVLKHADASGVSSIVFPSANDAGSDYAYIQYQENVGGASQKGLLTIGIENDSGQGPTADRLSLYAAGGSGFVGVNTKAPIFHLDISGTANVSSTLTTNVIDPSNVASLMTIAQSQTSGNLDIGNNASRSGAINIGTANTSKTITVGGASSGTTSLQGGTITINPASILELGNNDADVAISIGRDQVTGTLDIGNFNTRTAAINIGTGSSSKTMSIGGAATTLQMYGVDASFAGNVKLGSGNKFVAINKDVSANVALDVSGATVLRGITSTLSDVSINGKLLVSGDVSLNQKLFVNSDVSFNSNLSIGQALTVNSRALFSADVSLNKNTRLGTGINSVAINKDISSQYALDVSGITNLRAPLYTLSDVSINGKLSVGGDISLNGNIAIGTTVQTIGIGLKQPPAPMTANVTNIPGHGSYYAYTSSLAENLNIFRVFDNNNNTNLATPYGYTSFQDPSTVNFWANSGLFTDTIYDVTSTAYLGFRFHLDLPYQINLSRFDYRNTNSGRYPAQGSMLGSNNGTSWYNIYNFDLSGTYNNNSGQTGAQDFSFNTASNTGFYSKYALVIKSIACTPPDSLKTSARLGISEIKLYGNNNILSTQSIGATSIGVSDNLTVGETANFNGNVTIGSINNVYNRTGAARLLIMEPSGTVASATSGSLVLQHGDASGVSSIVFRSANDVGSDYAYIQYQENVGSGTTQKGLLTIGVENDAGSGTTADRMSLYAAGGSGFIGLNTLDPQYHLDLSGNARISGAVIASLDVSLNRNVDIGSGNNSVSINKDISSNFALDVSGITNLRAPLYTVADVSISGKLFATGDASFNTNLFVGQDLSVNRFLYVNNATLFNGDVSTNQNLYVAGKATFGRPPATGGTYELDMSGQMRIYEQIGSNVISNTSVATLTLEHADASGASSIMFKSPSTASNGDYAYIKYQDLSGATTNAGLLTIGIENDPTATTTRDRISLYAAGGSGFIGLNTLDPSFNLDVSGNANVSSSLFVNTINPSSAGSTLNIASTQTNGIINIATEATRTANINIGNQAATNTIRLGNFDISNNKIGGHAGLPTTVFTSFKSDGGLRIGEGMSGGLHQYSFNSTTGSIQIAGANRTSGNIEIGCGNTNASHTMSIGTGETNAGKLNIANGALSTGSINILDGSGSTGTAIIGRNNAIRIVNSATTTVDVSATGVLTLRGSSLNVIGATLFSSDVSLNQNAKLGAGTNSIAINKDISSQYALDVSGTTNLIGPLYTLGDVSLGQKLFVSSDVSINTNLYVGGDVSINGNLSVANSVFLLNSDISTNQNLYVAGRATFGSPPTSGTTYELDVSGQMRIYEQTGSNVISNTSVATLTLEHADASGASSIMFKSPSTASNGDYAYIKYQDLSGATTNAGLLTIGIENDPTATNADKISLYAAGGSGYVGVNTLNPGYNLDVSGNVNVSSTFYTNTIESLTSSSTLTIAGTDRSGTINIGHSGTTGRIISIGSSATSLYLGGSQIRLRDTGNGSVSFGRISSDTTQDSTGVTLLSGVNTTGSVRIMDGSGSTGTTTIGRNNAIQIVNSATTTVDVSATGLLTLRGSSLNVVGATRFNSDVSFNQNAKLGAGTNAIAINKDISSQYALDISGATNFRGVISTLSDISINGRLFTSGDVSLNQKLFVNGDVSLNQKLLIGQDLSVNRFLYAANNALFNTDVSINQNLYVSGRTTVGRPPTSTAYEFDVSGQMRIYETVGTSASATSGSLTLEHGDASGVSSIVFRSKNNNPSDYGYLQYQENVGGSSEKGLLTLGIENDATGGASDRISLYSAGGIGFVGVNTKDPAYHLDISGSTKVSGNTILTLDVSMNRNAQIGAGSNSVSINKDISSQYALDISGATNFRGIISTLSDVSVNGRLFTSGDVSMNQKLFVNGDVSFNANLAVGVTLQTRKIEPFDITANGAILIGSTLSGSSASVKIGTTNGTSSYVDIGNTTVFGGNLRFNENGKITGNSTGLTMSFADNTTTGNVSVGPALTSGNLILGSISATTHAGNILIGNGSGRTGSILIGGHNSSSVTYVNAGSVRVKDQGNGTFYVGRIPGDTTSDAITVALAGAVTTTGNVDILNGASSTGNINLGRGPAIKIANGTSTNIDISAAGTLALRGTTVTAPTTALDNSSNQVATTAFVKNNISNLVAGAGAALDTLYELSNAINNDASFGYNIVTSIGLRAYDSSVVHITGTESIAGNKTFTNDTVMGGNLTVSENLTTVQKGAFGYGTAPAGTPYEFDISGQMRIYELVGSDVTGNTSVATLTLEHGDVSGCSSIMFKSPSTASNGDYAYIKYQDLSGTSTTTNAGLLTIGVENDPTAATTRDRISLYAAGGSGFIGINTLDPSFNLDISGNANVRNTLITNSIDVSNAASTLTIAESQTTGIINIGAGSRTSGAINLATGSGNQATALNWGTSSNSGQLTFRGGTFNFSSTGNLTFNSSYSELTANIITGTRTSGTVNLVTGNPSGATTNAFTGNATNNAILNIATGSRTAGSDINIANNTSSAETLNIGTGEGRSGTINIGTGNTGTKTIGIGGSLTTINLTGKSVTATSDVSLNANTRLGAGSNSVAINKDISSQYALDISGETNMRGNLSLVGGTITVNGQPLTGSAGTSLTTQGVKVGTDANYFVTVDKTNFYNDPSLVIYYNFDTSFNNGTQIRNVANPGTFDLALSTNSGAITGMIDTVKYKYGTASLKNDSALTNRGANTSNPQISNIMSFSFWINKQTATSAAPPDFDRIFEFTNNTAFGSVTEFYTVALDVSASGLIIPTITKGSTGTSSIISTTTQLRSYTIADSSWNHVSWVINNLNSYLYLNGSIVQQNTLSEKVYNPFPSDIWLYYQMENNANNTGQLANMNGTLVGPPTFNSTTFKKGQYSLQSTGASQYISIPSFTWPTSGITISTWFYRTSPGTYNLFAFGNVNLNFFSSGYPNNIYLNVGASQPITYPNSDGSLNFAHIAVTLTPDGAAPKLYINGSYKSAGVTYTTYTYPSGTYSNNFIGQHAGYTDDFRVYNSVLSAQQIADIYNEGNTFYDLSTNRNLMIIAGSTLQNRDFSGNIDEFRYYKDKALNQAEIYQLNNNTFFNLDICGGFLANGSSVIFEPIGSKATANSGTLTLLHGDASGSSSIMFKSVNDPLEYGYIQYEENTVGSTGYHYGLMTIGIENDAGTQAAYTDQADRVSLFPSGGRGFVGVNTKTPYYSLDVSGQIRILEGAGTSAAPTAGSLILEHTAVGGTSSIMFKGPNTTTSDYAYVQYTDASSVVQSLLKYDLSTNSPTTLTGLATLASTGTNSTNTTFYPTDNSFAWFDYQTSGLGAIKGVVTPQYCLSFNQANVTTGGTNISPLRMNYLETTYTMGSAADITFSAWIRPSGIDISQSTPGRIYILYAANGGTSGTGVIDMYIEINSNTNKGKLFCLINADSTNYQLTDVSINQNQWNHVALSFSSTNKNGRLYLNNVPATNELTGFNGKVLNYLDKFWIGNNYYGTTATNWLKGFRGLMAFINIFDKALSASDIAYLYNNPAYNVTTNPERGLLTIGVENDTGIINNDRIVLWPGAGTGNVGINTRTPTATLDVSGQMNISGQTRINGQLLISESGSGTAASIYSGSLMLQHVTAGGTSSIVFPSVTNNTSDYAYIQYHDSFQSTDFSGTTFENGLLIIGVENDGTTGNSSDRISLFACGGTGYVGINTKNPKYTLDVNGNVNATSYNASSDYRIKTNVMPLDLTFTVDVLNPVSYVLKDDKEAKKQIGFIAHEVQEFYPFLVNGVKDGPDTQSINYNGFIGILTKEIKDLKAKIAEQDERLQMLEKLLLNK